MKLPISRISASRFQRLVRTRDDCDALFGVFYFKIYFYLFFCGGLMIIDSGYLSIPGGKQYVYLITITSFPTSLTHSHTSSLHYVYIESLRAPATDDTILWFNGGWG